MVMLARLVMAAGLLVARAASKNDKPTYNGHAYDNPLEDGGSMLTFVNDTYPPGLGEPLNVIVSGQSDPIVLVDSLFDGGFQNYMTSTNLSGECLGAKFGDLQVANLGDGRGKVNETQTLRWNFGDPYLGSCRETFDGGLHLRYWQQASSGAFFLAVSDEMDLARGHDIVPNGYNQGRDQLVGNVTGHLVATRNVTNETTFTGISSYKNWTYETSVSYVSGLLKNSSDDINHYHSVEEDGFPAIDGLVAVLTVRVLEVGVMNSAWTAHRVSVASLLLSATLAAIASVF